MNRNRTLSWFAVIGIIFVMLFSLIPVSAFAENETEPDIKISDYTAPAGSLEKGKGFGLRGKISCDEKMTNIKLGVYYRNNEPTEQYISCDIESNNFDVSSVDSKICFGKLEEGLYRYMIYASTEKGTKKLVQSDFIIGNIADESKIEVKNTNFPSGVMKYGKSFKINCDILSVQPLRRVYSNIYKKNADGENDEIMWAIDIILSEEGSQQITSYSISEERSNTFDIANLETGEYFYQLAAVDFTGYKKILNETDFSVKKAESDSEIELSDAEVPEGVLKHGTYFNLRGNITSKYKLKTVIAEIISRDNNSVIQKASFNPDSTSFNFFPDIDYSMIFENLNTGKYTFKVEAEDEKGYKKDVVVSDFEIGESNAMPGDANMDKKISIADAVAVSAYIGNPDKNFLQPIGIKNGDVHNKGNGLDANDSLAIQQYIAQIIKSFE